MSLSKFAKDIVEKVISTQYNYTRKNNVVTYDITLSDNRANPSVMTSSFKFKRPIKEEVVEAKMSVYVDILSQYLAAENLGVIDSILHKYGLKKESIGQSKVSGTIPANTEESEELTGDDLLSIRSKSGRFISISNFKSLLEIATKAYMMYHMTSGGPQLHNRTGRFINSTNIVNIRVLRTGMGSKYLLSISYGYMKYPYETFDPAGPNSRGLASVERNPRKIIGDAIHKAVDDLVNMEFYSLEVTQR